jgi:nucleoside-diphosphate-sugar epimerase
MSFNPGNSAELKTAVVTGAAGFIGSNLVIELSRILPKVIGIDNFLDESYDSGVKRRNAADLSKYANFEMLEADLTKHDLISVLDSADVVIHLAAMPGLAKSWTDFDLYNSHNLVATQKLAESSIRSKKLKKFILASTSSVYGKYAVGDELQPTRPISPYGVTKLASEHILTSYFQSTDISLSILRFFSVFGPRQRPDMAYYRFIKAILNDETITIYGDGSQIRSNTYVGDCVNGVLGAIFLGRENETYNLAGPSKYSILEIIEKIELLTNKKAKLSFEKRIAGDQEVTQGDYGKAKEHFGYSPLTKIDDGLANQIEWFLKSNRI